MAYSMGVLKKGCLRVDFDRRLKLQFHGSKIILVCWPIMNWMMLSA
jgi:hypothetical protein